MLRAFARRKPTGTYDGNPGEAGVARACPRHLTRWRPLLLGAALSLAAACSGGGGDPAEAVERYLQAKVNADTEAIRELLCAAMEAMLEQEANTFRGVTGAAIEGMDCTREGESDVVNCEGRITAQYGTEEEEFPLTSYRVVEEDGEWKWCGEAP